MSARQTTQSFLLQLGQVKEVDLVSGLGQRRFDALVQAGVLAPAVAPRVRRTFWLALGLALALAVALLGS